MSVSGTTFTVAGSGTDIWGASDQFRFVYQPVSGDVDIRARVTGIGNTSDWAKAGVMIRESLAANAANVYALASSGHGLAFQQRAQTGGTSTTTSGEAANPPRWLRLVRSGTSITAYSSSTGTSWTTIGRVTMTLPATFYVGIAVTSHAPRALTQATLTNVAVSTTSLPTGMSTSDIGSPAVAGSASYANGVFTLTGGGSDIWDTADQFRFVYQQVSGDMDLKARVTRIDQASAWSKAGLMIRESLAPGSRNALMSLTAGKGYSFQWRLDENGLSDRKATVNGKAPGWIRLVRTGSRFEGFRSSDGVSWVSLGSETVPMADTVYVGLAVTSRNVTTATTGVLDNISMAATSAPPNQKPIVTLTSPVGGAQYATGTAIPVSATASDPEGRLARVEFFANATRIGTDTTSPFSISWTPTTAGSYSITAVAFDAENESATSTAATITVGAATNQPPTVSLTAPANNATFTAPATIAIAATAADPENRLSKVEFYVGATLVATDTTSPFSASYTTSTPGTYQIKAIAYDANGGVTTSSIRTVTVTGTTPPTPKTVSFTASADHAAKVTSYRLDVFANGANPATATPIASSSLGKPTPDGSNVISVDRATFLAALAPATYVATVSAIGAGGESRSTSITFTR